MSRFNQILANCIKPQEGDLSPRELASLPGLCVRECFNGQTTFHAAMLKVGSKLFLGVRPCGENPRRIQLIQREQCWRNESIHRAGQVKIEPEKRVVGYLPEL
jgi:hypothetical protein